MSNWVALIIAVAWAGAALLVFFHRSLIWLTVRHPKEQLWDPMVELRGNRMLIFGLAVVLVAVPTFASLFPGFILRVSRGWRIGAMLGWLVVAVLATLASQSRESAAHAMTRASHWLVLRQAIAGILTRAPDSVNDHYQFSIHLLSQEGDCLLPWYPDTADSSDDPAIFDVGCGAVGHCFKSEDVVVAVGDAVSSNEPFGLSEAQRERYAGFQVVAAVPVRLPSDLVIGALSVIGHTNDGYFASEDGELQERGVKLLRDLADKVGDLLGLEGIEWGW